MALAGYGSLGQVVETLPAGFAYAGSGLSESQVAVVGQTVTFTLLGEETFTYAVTAPAAEGSYVFSGIIKDVNRVEASVVGASSIRVGPPPTPTPAPTPTPTPDTHTHAHARADADTHTHARADTHTHAHARADANRHLDARTDCCPHSHSAAAFG